MALTGDLYEAVIKIVDERVGEIKISREMYDRLVIAVTELAEAQKRTEQRLEALAEAQKRTEERLNELADAQKRTELNISTLTERTNRLEGAVERLDGAVERLAEAQKRTEQRFAELSEAMKDLATAVGRLSDTVGYGLEDVARVMLPPWLARHERVHVDDLDRRFIQVEGEPIEVNLYGEGLKGRVPVKVIGEARSRIHAGDVKGFAVNVEKVRKALEGERILPVMFGFWVHPSATSLAKTLRIRLVASYQR